MSYMNYDEVLDRISPSSDETKKIDFAIQEIKSFIENSASNSSIDVDVVPGGSTAKGTFLKGDHDIDIFVRFKSDKKNLSDDLEELLSNLKSEKNIIVKRVHGSRDYFQFDYSNFNFEIVPVKYIDDFNGADNVTDMSSLHVFWAEEHLNDKLRKDILLAKQFCKSQGVYGAESYINGISGHVLDILIIYYGSFESFLENVSRWNELVVIDSENKHEDVFKSMNEAKLKSPLIVVDPIDSMRNASASICKDKFDKLIFSANEFIANPSEDFFIIKNFSFDELKNSKSDGEALLILELEVLEGNKDVVGTKILKIKEYLERELTDYGFTINDSVWNFDNISHIAFFIDETPLSRSFVRKGPAINSKPGSDKFIEKHKDNVFEKNGFLYVNLKREFILSNKFLSYLIKEEYCNSRAKSINLLL